MQLEKYMRVVHCTTCGGDRLNPQACGAVRVGDRTLIEVGAMSIGQLCLLIGMENELEPIRRIIASELLKEIRSRVNFLLNVGLHYLSLDQQRRPFPAVKPSAFVSPVKSAPAWWVCFISSMKPSIGLHPRDTNTPARSLERLRDMGNTVLVVEHDEDTMCASDFLVDFGPGPGIRGGEVIASGHTW